MECHVMWWGVDRLTGLPVEQHGTESSLESNCCTINNALSFVCEQLFVRLIQVLICKRWAGPEREERKGGGVERGSILRQSSLLPPPRPWAGIVLWSPLLTILTSTWSHHNETLIRNISIKSFPHYVRCEGAASRKAERLSDLEIEENGVNERGKSTRETWRIKTKKKEKWEKKISRQGYERKDSGAFYSHGVSC